MSFATPKTPFIDTQTITPGFTAAAGSFVYDMRGIDRASLQLNVFFDQAFTSTITLKISNDGVNFVGFSTAKTLVATDNVTGFFDLGSVDYAYLSVNWTAGSASHDQIIIANMYGVATKIQQA